MTTSLDDIRSRAEEFYQELEKEYYLEGAGLIDTVNAAAIYERYADLSSRSLLEFLQQQLVGLESHSPQGKNEDARKTKMLLETTVQTYLGNVVREETDQLLTTESNGVVQVDGEVLGFRASAVRLMNESDRKVRGRIADARDGFTADTLNPLHQTIFEATQSETSALGYPNYVEMAQQLNGIDLYGLHAITERFLSETEDMYVDTLGWYVKRELGISLNDLQKHDLSFLARGPNFDKHFPADQMVDTVLGFVKRMGIDPTAGGHINLDIESRPKKSPRAFCSTVRVPDEVYLVIMPSGGADDYEAFLHELGHALHFGHVSPTLDWEYKRLGDNSVTEGFAIGFDHLVQDRVWLKKVMKIDQPDDFIKHVNLIELMMLRRYSAKLSYELVLHDGRSLEGKEETYAGFLSHATKARYTPAQYLADVDSFFYCARYLRAWMVQSMLHQYLKENFDEDWFLNPRSGEFLKELWSQGQRHTAEELARNLAYPSLTMEFMKDSIEEELGQ